MNVSVFLHLQTIYKHIYVHLTKKDTDIFIYYFFHKKICTSLLDNAPNYQYLGALSKRDNNVCKYLSIVVKAVDNNDDDIPNVQSK